MNNNHCDPADPNCTPRDSYSKLLGLANSKRMVGRTPVRGTPFTHVMYDDGTCCCHDHCGQVVPHHVVAAAATQAAAQGHSDAHLMAAGHNAALPMHGDPAHDLDQAAQHTDLLNSIYRNLHNTQQSTVRQPR